MNMKKIINCFTVLFFISCPLFAGWDQDGISSLNLSNVQSGKQPVIICPDTTPYVAWVENNGISDKLVIKYLENNDWVLSDDNINESNTGNATALCMTNSGNIPYVAWCEEQYYGQQVDIHVKQLAGALWTTVGEIVNEPGTHAADLDMTIYNGTPFVTWMNTTVSNGNFDIHAKYFNGSGWTNVSLMPPDIGLVTNAPVHAPAIAVYNDVPYIAWSETNGIADQVWVKKYNGSGWEQVGSNSLNIDPNAPATNPDIDFYNGTPYVAFEESTSGVSQIYVKYFNGSDWIIHGAQSLNISSASHANWPSMAIAASGEMMVSFHEATSNTLTVFVKIYEGGSWQAVGNLLNMNANSEACFSNLAFKDSTPYVVWQEELIGKNKIYVKHFNWIENIYRSVGPNNTSELANGLSNSMGIYGEIASFSSDLPDNIGVGDVIEYDSDDNGSIDNLAFIHQRISNSKYIVKNGSGGQPAVTLAPDNNWAIHRAYTSLNNAMQGTENLSVNGTLRNFDFWSIHDLVTEGLVWNIACYADAIDTTAVGMSNWITNADHYIKIFTPMDVQQTGSPQRHSGVYGDMGYRLEVDNYYCIYSYFDNIKIDGLQFAITAPQSMAAAYIQMAVANNLELEVSNCVFAGYTANWDLTGIDLTSVPNGIVKIWNNIFYDFARTSVTVNVTGINVNDSDYAAYIYNNTFVNCVYGIRVQSGSVAVKNNIIQGSVDGFVGTFNADSTNNLSDLPADAPGSSAINQAVVQFINSAAHDYHLSSIDIAAHDKGANLTSDVYIGFDNDIDFETRVGNWDIGADEMNLAVIATPTNTPVIITSGTLTPTPTITLSVTPGLLEEVRIRRNVYRPGIGIPIYIDVPVAYAQKVMVKIYNRRGRLVKTVIDKQVEPGNFEAVWKGLNENNKVVGSGIYIVHIKTDKINETRKLAVIR